MLPRTMPHVQDKDQASATTNTRGEACSIFFNAGRTHRSVLYNDGPYCMDNTLYSEHYCVNYANNSLQKAKMDRPVERIRYR